MLQEQRTHCLIDIILIFHKPILLQGPSSTDNPPPFEHIILIIPTASTNVKILYTLISQDFDNIHPRIMLLSIYYHFSNIYPRLLNITSPIINLFIKAATSDELS